MPGSIRVSVLKCVDLPAEAIEGNSVSIKVGIGKREFQSKHSKADGDKTAVLNSNFAFPVLNLRDNVIVTLVDSKGNAISRTEIGTPVIIEKGSLEELFPLKGGGCVHLKLSFVLTLEERMRIEAMREAALQKKERRTVNKNTTSQVLNPAEENRTYALASDTGISQNISDNSKSNDGIHNGKNQIAGIVAPQVSVTDEMQEKTENIKEVLPAPISWPTEIVTHKETSSYDLKNIPDQDLKEYGLQYLPRHDLEKTLLPNEIQNKTDNIDEASLAPKSLPIEHDTHKDATCHDLKEISDHDLEGNRHQHLPLHDLEEGDTTAVSKESTLLRDSSILSSNISLPKAQLEGAMQANVPFASGNLMPGPLPPMKDSLAESENSEIHVSIDKLPIIESVQTESEKDMMSTFADPVIVSEVPSSQALLTSHGTEENRAPRSPLDQQYRTLTTVFSASYASLESSDGENFSSSSSELVRGRRTSDMHPPEPSVFLGVDGTTNMLPIRTSNEDRTILGTENTHAVGPSLHEENRTLTITSSGSCPPPASSDTEVSDDSAIQFATGGGTSDILHSELRSLSGIGGIVIVSSAETSNKEDITSSSFSTKNAKPLQSSKDGSTSLTLLIDSPCKASGEENIPFPNLLPESPQPCQVFQVDQSVESTGTSVGLTAHDATILGKNIIVTSHSDSAFCTEDLSMNQTSSSVVNVENVELISQDICTLQNNKINSSDAVLHTGSDYLAGKAKGGLREGFSLPTFPNQSSTAEGQIKSFSSNISNLINKQGDNVASTSFPKTSASHTIMGDRTQSSVKAKIKAFESTLSSQRMKGGSRSGVKEKIKAFESSLAQNPDCHNSPPRKTPHKIEAERARQRLRAEAAAAEAAEAIRQAEEKEAKLKSIAEARERKQCLSQRPEESRFQTPANLKRNYLERNKQEEKRRTKEDIKDITVAEEDIRTHKAYRRREEGIQKGHEKRPEMGERNIKHEDMAELRKPLKERGENLLRAIEAKDKKPEEDPRQETLSWDKMELRELQLKRNWQNETLKSDLSAKKNEVLEESMMTKSMKQSQSRTASEPKEDVGVQVGKIQLHKHEAGNSVAEARWTAHEKAKQEPGTDHDLIVDQRVHSITPSDSSVEDVLAEENATISEEKLEDLVNGSAAFGGVIKQVLGVAAVLAAGALFIWMRGEQMNRRRSRTTQPNNQHYFLPNDEAASRILQGESQQLNSRISKGSQDLLCP